MNAKDIERAQNTGFDDDADVNEDGMFDSDESWAENEDGDFFGNGPEMYDDDDFEYGQGDMMFANPGGNSALRAASPSNPRNLPCPTCDAPNRLTPEDVRLGYQCDYCADMAERGGY